MQNDTILSSEFSSSPELVEKLYQYGITKNYHQGDIILDENASIRSIPIVMKGMLKVIRTEEDGREIKMSKSRGDNDDMPVSALVANIPLKNIKERKM